MAILFMDGFDKYGAANSNSTSVATLMTQGEWTTVGGTTIVAPLSANGQAVNITGANAGLAKTLSANYTRVFGGFRFSSLLSAGPVGIVLFDSATAQASVGINQTTGTISVRNGQLNGTALTTSAASVSASSVHYLEFDISIGNSAAYQVWLDGVSVINSTGDTTTTANNFVNRIGLGTASGSGDISLDDFYLFDSTGTTNNAVLLTSPRIETQLPTSDGAVQFAFGAAIVGNSVARTAATAQNTSANQFRVRPVVPAVSCTINSIALLGGLTTSGTINLRPVVYSDSAGSPGTLMSGGATLTGITAGAAKTMPLTTPQALTAGTQYWIGHMCDIVATNALAQYDGNSTDRTATATFASGAPGTAPASSAVLSTVIWGNVTVVGANWYENSQNPTQGNLSYVFDATVGHEDLYSFAPLSAPPASIYAVAVKANVARSDSGSRTVSMRTKSGATDSAGSLAGQTPATTFGWLASYFPTDPNTSAAWTGSNLDAATSGLKIDS